MHARVLVLLIALTGVASAEDSETTLHAALGTKGEEIRLVTQIGGKTPAVTLQVGKDAATKLADGDAVGALETAHGITVIALAVDSAKDPFRIAVVGTETQTKLARPRKTHDVPFALALTPTPSGFTAFFQEIEAANANEAHTYMQKLDKQGAPDGDLVEVQVPWWLGDAAWNGNGYHLALYYAGDMTGVRLSMVTTNEAGQPQQHPDWASNPGLISDVHLVASGGKVRAYYRGGVGDRLISSDVTAIGNWGGPAKPESDLGAFAANQTIAIDASGKPVRVKPAPVAAPKVVKSDVKTKPRTTKPKK